ncbi:FecR family protein [Aquimarina agarilytica]|uniref:FecR family protein n=1 Tax=Aquimarina agarilytica TaxID=1087449 RepID=UPI0002882363|nr:FecR family protein [Aquimarina agarilytica]
MEDFLAKWASGDLSENDKKVFEQNEDNKLYKDILEGVELLEVPEYDSDKLYAKLKSKIEDNTTADTVKSSKVVSIIPKWVYGIAASVILVFGLTLFFKSEVSYSSDYGKQLSFKLPDNSEVFLNANSKLSYDEKKWETNRTLNLEGEAFFKVTKGSKFTVKTKKGNVSVLGTQFNVDTNSKTDVFQVNCFEGVVKVVQGNISEIIRKGQAVRIVDKQLEKWEFNEAAPLWVTKESSFYNSPINQVVKALENQYNIKIKSSKVNDSLRFTGVFTHTDLNKALKIVFESLDVNYKFEGERSIILFNK